MKNPGETMTETTRRSTIPAAIAIVILALVFATLMVSSRWRGEAESMRQRQADLAEQGVVVAPSENP